MFEFLGGLAKIALPIVTSLFMESDYSPRVSESPYMHAQSTVMKTIKENIEPEITGQPAALVTGEREKAERLLEITGGEPVSFDTVLDAYMNSMFDTSSYAHRYVEEKK